MLDRSTNVGYMCYDNDTNIVDGVAKVFPIFFFLIAALVCSTTMTRMVDDERGQIGTYRALGYTNGHYGEVSDLFRKLGVPWLRDRILRRKLSVPICNI